MPALSHVCPQCGWDLARVRAPLDSALGLRIALCPRCGRGWARRRPDAAAQRLFRALDALSGLALALLITGSLLLWSSGLILGLSRASAASPSSLAWLVHVRDASTSTGWDMERLRFLAVFAALSLASGAWIVAAMSHWRMGALFPLWILAIFAGSAAGEVGWALLWPVARLFGHALPYAGADAVDWAHRSELALAFAAVMLAGAPVGLGARALERKGRAALLRWRLRQLRKERRRS